MFRRKQTHKTSKPKSYKVWHLVLTVFLMATTMRVALGTLPSPEEVEASRQYQHISYMNRPLTYRDWQRRYERRAQRLAESPITRQKPAIEVLPFNMQGEVPGPLLAAILQQYLPDSTAMQTASHADDLRCTLPPCDNPRMIVILPEEEDPLY